MADATSGGKTGVKMGDIHSVFHKRLQELQDQARRAHNAFRGRARHQWQIPSEYTGSLLNVNLLHLPAFDRTKINDNYEAVTRDPSNPGTVGDVIGIKLQLEYVAGEERAFRARHASYCRTMCLGHGRRYGQGHGNIWDGKAGVEGMAASYIAAGANRTGG